MERIYISAPLSLDWKTVDLFRRRFDNTFDVRVWDRDFNNFIESDFRLSDSVLFLLPRNGFQSSLSSLPIGVRKEAERAREMGKRIYVGYVTSAGDYNIYCGTINASSIQAISGTANTIFKNRSSYKSNDEIINERVKATVYTEDFAPKKSIVERYSEFDNRILLMLQ